MVLIYFFLIWHDLSFRYSNPEVMQIVENTSFLISGQIHSVVLVKKFSKKKTKKIFIDWLFMTKQTK